jgi:cysteine protease ATG4
LFYLDPHFTRPAIPLKTRTEKRDPSDPTRVIDSAHDNDPRNDGASAEVDWLLGVYTSDQLKTFHCDKVKKMPISSLDPSMLIGFLCKDNDDWLDLRERLNNVSR